MASITSFLMQLEVVLMDKSILESSEFYDKRFNNFSTMIITPIAVLLVLTILFSLISQKEITVKSLGQIDSGKAVPIVQSTSNNKILHNYLHEGQYVSKGKTLVTYQSASTNRQLDLMRRENDLLQQQITDLDTLKNSILQNQNLFSGNDKFGYEDVYKSYTNQRQVYLLENNLLTQKSNQETNKKGQITNNLNANLQTYQNQLASYNNVLQAIKNGSRPNNSAYSYIYQDYLQQNNVLSSAAEQSANREEYLNNLQQHIDQLQSNIQSTTQQKLELNNFDSSQFDIASNNQKISGLQNEQLKSISESKVNLNQKKDENDLKIRNVESEAKDLSIKAPISGVVHVLNPDNRSKLIGTGNPLAQIYPELDNSQLIKLKAYISPNDITSVKKGQKLRLKIVRNVPTPIILEGTIKTISVAPITLDKNNYYVVEALSQIPRKQISNLHYGMSGQGSVITGKESFFTYYKNKIFNQEDNLN